ncbi:hypothetical protein ACFWM0_03790 [Streptomyces sp. NPDC058405]|uniref:hypothetical protein n=1 Tax=Streptomyces sp. NPDC058405 TaxID=3346482 RepID=UPI003669D3CA
MSVRFPPSAAPPSAAPSSAAPRFGELAAEIQPSAGVKAVLEPGRFLVADHAFLGHPVAERPLL